MIVYLAKLFWSPSDFVNLSETLEPGWRRLMQNCFNIYLPAQQLSLLTSVSTWELHWKSSRLILTHQRTGSEMENQGDILEMPILGIGCLNKISNKQETRSSFSSLCLLTDLNFNSNWICKIFPLGTITLSLSFSNSFQQTWLNMQTIEILQILYDLRSCG